VATFQEAVFIVAHFNIHLERSDDLITKQLTDLLCDYWISVRPTTATHNAGGTNDTVIAHCVINDSQLKWTMDFILPSVDLAACWSQDAAGVSNRRCCPWRQLDVTQSTLVKASRLCQSTMWPDDIDDIWPLCTNRKSVITAILNRLTAIGKVTRVGLETMRSVV